MYNKIKITFTKNDNDELDGKIELQKNIIDENSEVYELIDENKKITNVDDMIKYLKEVNEKLKYNETDNIDM